MDKARNCVAQEREFTNIEVTKWSDDGPQSFSELLHVHTGVQF